MKAMRFTIFQAIQELGGINPEKAMRAGKGAEWKEIDNAVRLQIFRRTSVQGPDSVAEQLGNYHPEFGVFSENDLLDYLGDPRKLKLDNAEASDYDLLIYELEQARMEIALLRGEKHEEIGFVKTSDGRFVPYRYRVSDVPF